MKNNMMKKVKESLFSVLVAVPKQVLKKEIKIYDLHWTEAILLRTDTGRTE